MSTTTSRVESTALNSGASLGSASSSKGLVGLLLGTEAATAPALARVALGLTILPHGAQKLLGWFGGYGFQGTMGFFTQMMHIPAPLAFAAIMAESLGAVALILGLGSRLAAAAVGTVMAVAMVTVHWQNGFFMNWFGAQKGEGIEYFVLAIGLALIVLVAGGGRFSLDRAIAGNRN